MARKRRSSGLPPLPPLGSPSSEPAKQEPKPRTAFDEWRDGLTPAEKTIQRIEDMMLAGRWSSGRSARWLAEELGVSPSYIRSLAAETSRSLARFVRDQDPQFRLERRAQLVCLFEAVTQRALSMNTPNALRVALEAAELQGRYLGVEPPKVLQVSKRGEFEDLSDAQVKALADGENDAENERRDADDWH